MSDQAPEYLKAGAETLDLYIEVAREIEAVLGERLGELNGYAGPSVAAKLGNEILYAEVARRVKQVERERQLDALR